MSNKRGLYVKHGETCPKCGYSSCDHNEDPVCDCPETDGNPSPPNPTNYFDGEASAQLAALDAAGVKAEEVSDG